LAQEIAMAVPIACPHCGHFVSISDEKYAATVGKTAKCNKCGKPFFVQRAVAPTTATANTHSSPAQATPQPAPMVQPAPVVVQFAAPQVVKQTPENDGGEKDIWSANPSLWIGFRTYFWCGLLSLLCMSAGAVFSGWALLGILLFIGIAGIRVLRIKAIHYHLTSQRLRVTHGLVSRKIVEIELFRVRDLTIEQGFIQRLLTLGTVKAISTDEDAKTIHLSGIKDAMNVKENLRRFVMESRKATGTRDMDMAVVR
jgi:membrane protein YdbS with pleckstrin-like domain